MTNLKLAAVAVLGLSLAACGFVDRDKIAGMQAPSAFGSALQKGYVEFADMECAEYDWRDCDYFLKKALAASQNGDVEPDTIGSRDLPADKVQQLTAARERLTGIFDQGAKEKAPEPAARAQVAFECWMEQQEENHQPEDIARCRDQFFAAVQEAEAAMAPKPMAKEPEPKPMPAPQPARPDVDGLYIVYFDFNSAELTQKAKNTLIQAASDYGLVFPESVVVGGHADTSGAKAYNSALSERRAKAVADFLGKIGVDPARIELRSFGENQPIRPTPDGTREERNRRVEVVFQ